MKTYLYEKFPVLIHTGKIVPNEYHWYTGFSNEFFSIKSKDWKLLFDSTMCVDRHSVYKY